MIISIRLFAPGKNFSTDVTSHIQEIIVSKLIQTKSDQINPGDFFRVKIITYPLFFVENSKVIRDNQNRIEIKRNGTNLFRKTLPSFEKEAEKFETELLKEISVHIGNNLKIIH